MATLPAQVHITLHTGPGGLTAGGNQGEASEAHQLLAAALGKALEGGSSAAEPPGKASGTSAA